jgi:hypothetical protein
MEPWADYQTPPDIPWNRCCRANMAQGTRRFEVPSKFAVEGPPVLLVACDESIINLSPMCFLISQGYRIILQRDYAHRAWNDYKNALVDAKLWTEVLSLTHSMNCRHGPWSSCSWFRQCVESLRAHQAASTSCDPLFECLWPMMAKDDKDLVQHCEPGSRDERDLLWKHLSHVLALEKKGTRVSMTRWFHFVAAFAEFRKNYHMHLYMYCLCLWYSGVVRNITEFPIWDQRSSLKTIAKFPKVHLSGKKPTMREASAEEKAEVDKIKAENSIHLAAICLGQPGTWRRSGIIHEIGSHLHKAFSLEQAALKDKGGWFRWHLAYATKASGLLLRRVWGTITSLQSLQRMAFDCENLSGTYLGALHGGGAGAASSSEAPVAVLAPSSCWTRTRTRRCSRSRRGACRARP